MITMVIVRTINCIQLVLHHVIITTAWKYYYYLLFWQRNNDGPLLSIINKNNQHKNNIPYTWLNHNNNKAMRRNSVKFYLTLQYI